MQLLTRSCLSVSSSYHVVHHKPESYRQSQACLTTSDGTQAKSEGTQATVHGMADVPCKRTAHFWLTVTRACSQGAALVVHTCNILQVLHLSALMVLHCYGQCVTSHHAEATTYGRSLW